MREPLLALLVAATAGCPVESNLANPQVIWLAPDGQPPDPVSHESGVTFDRDRPSPFLARGLGSGDSEEASYELQMNVPAGTYHVVTDAIITAPVDVTLDLLWRNDGADVLLAEWTEHDEPVGDSSQAQPFDHDVAAPLLDIQHHAGELVLRFVARNTTAAEAYIPNGDNQASGGRIPNITLPR